MRKKTLNKTHKYGLGTCVVLLRRCVHFSRMIDEKFRTLNVRLGGLEKTKERKECLQDVRNTKANGGCNSNVMRNKVNNGCVVENVLIECGGAFVRNVGNKKYKYKESTLNVTWHVGIIWRRFMWRKVYAWRRFEDKNDEDV
ncbi:hypothetical protein Tco_1017528 [Tanacetum coccineum]|uniref:Transmembrane protein n=1 Tax=Tanacetum coccineum TaxID=301880 RepID=A0ABQ5FT46_9ASTR